MNINPFTSLFSGFLMTLYSYFTFANSILNHPDQWRIIASGLGFSLFSLRLVLPPT
ncbi:hypothetical protein [Macrococcus carouselicus]|uniref:hypothetical protein n=1 Tax=Macrococcus carouselicus TaxID=69969 RepID=UPI001407B30B|nr:hypothetical protein [Macrococcus carouselicus]